MRILWLVNILIPEISEKENLPILPYGGWLSGALNNISNKSDIEIIVCNPQPFTDRLLQGKLSDNIEYYSFYREPAKAFAYDELLENKLKEIVDIAKPDLIHIWGSEYPHALAMSKVCGNIKCILSIQGICEMYKYHYINTIPYDAQIGKTFYDIIHNKSIINDYDNFCKKSITEKEVFKRLKYFIGRTTWDYISTKLLVQDNDSRYFTCNEILRESFYNDSWNYDECEKNTIFISQCSYPIKGFHIMLEAAKYIKEKYPDFKIYTTGNNILEIEDKELSNYRKYIKKLIIDNKLEKNIEFLGELTEEKMCETYKKCNVFVSPSSIENSSNSIGEAMLLGMPIVASNVGGTESIMTNNVEGLLYQFDAPYLLAYYVCWLFENSEQAITLGQNAKARANVTHSKETNTNTLYDIYKYVLEDNM